MWKINPHPHILFVDASALVLTIEDPDADLRYVVPIRLYGDGADAQSPLAINNVTTFKFRVPTSPEPMVDCLWEKYEFRVPTSPDPMVDCLREAKIWNADHPVPRVSQQQHTRQPDIAARLHKVIHAEIPQSQCTSHPVSRPLLYTEWGPALWTWTIRKVVRHALVCWKCCLGPSTVWVLQL